VLVPRQLIVCTAAALAAALVFLGPARAGLDNGLCKTDGARGTIPEDFFVEACFDGKTLQLRNQSKIVLHVIAHGDVGQSTRTETDFDLSAGATRLKSNDPWVLVPGDTLHIPVGPGAARVSVQQAKHDDEVYGTGHALEGLVPTAKAAKGAKAGGNLGKGADAASEAAGKVNTWAALIDELANDYEQYSTCLAGANWFMQIGCRALLVRNVGFAYGRFGVKLGVKGVDLLLSPIEFIAFTHARVDDAQRLKGHTGAIVLAAVRKPPPKAPQPPPMPTKTTPAPQTTTTEAPVQTHSGAGSTTCDEFRGMSGDEQVKTVIAMMKDLHLATDQSDVFITRGSANAFCAVMPGGRTIDGIYHG
jgi:hypothetical protein